VDQYGEKYEFADNERYHVIIHVIESEEVGKGVKGGEDTVFVHLTVRKWDKTTLKLLRQDLENILNRSYELGIECVSFVVPKSLTTKFHNLLKPTDYEMDMPNDNILGGWYTDKTF